MTDERDVTELQVVQERCEITDKSRPGVIGAPTRPAVTTEVVRDHPETIGQLRHHGAPVPLTSRETVNEYDRRSVTAPVGDCKSCIILHERALHLCHVEAGHSGSGTENPTSLPHVLR